MTISSQPTGPARPSTPPPPPPPPPAPPAQTPVQTGTQARIGQCTPGAPYSATPAATPSATPASPPAAPPAPPVASWSARPQGDTFRTAWDATAARLGTQNPIAIRTEIERQQFQAQGLSAFQTAPATSSATSTPASPTAAPATAPVANRAGEEGPDPVKLGLDLSQMALDIVGIFEPTPFADGSNTLISIGRGITSLFSGDGEAGGHFLNGGLSALGIIPYVGDAAKLGKIGKWAQTVADGISAIAANPAARAAIEPGLKAIKDALDKIPQGALDKLPQSARESIEGMKRQLDEFLGGAASAGARVDNGTLVLGANRGATTTVNGRTVTIGDTPTTQLDNGRRVATDVSGNQVTVNQPRTYDTRTVNPDGTVDYTKGNRTVTYDANGFPVFKPKADLYLDVKHINSKDSDAHFKAANEALAAALKADPSLAQQIGLSQRQVDFITRSPAPTQSPPDLTWHHHQDTGRMQLVDRLEHNAFPGGHLGGMRLWGGGRS